MKHKRRIAAAEQRTQVLAPQPVCVSSSCADGSCPRQREGKGGARPGTSVSPLRASQSSWVCATAAAAGPWVAAGSVQDLLSHLASGVPSRNGMPAGSGSDPQVLFRTRQPQADEAHPAPQQPPAAAEAGEATASSVAAADASRHAGEQDGSDHGRGSGTEGGDESTAASQGCRKVHWTPLTIAMSIALFCIAGVAEIGGGWLIWEAIRCAPSRTYDWPPAPQIGTRGRSGAVAAAGRRRRVLREDGGGRSETRGSAVQCSEFVPGHASAARGKSGWLALHAQSLKHQ